MKKVYFLSILLIFIFKLPCHSQEKLWTEEDRKYTLDNLRRTRDELVKETENLTPAQWAFKESPDRWSIGEIVEHLAIWEVIWGREVGMGISNKPEPELNKTSRPDSYYHEFIMEDTPHTSSINSRPTGFIKGKDNLTFFLRGHKVTENFIESTKSDLKAHFELTNTPNPRNMHQVLIYQWGHVDRHLRQLRKVKAHPDYPKS